MLKWRRNKCGGSQPEGLDQIDSLSPETRRTQSMKSCVRSPRAISRIKNELFTRSCSELHDRKNFSNGTNESESMGCKRKNLRLVIDTQNTGRVDSPFVNVQLDDIYKGFEKASVSAPTSPQSDEEIHMVTTPKTSRQSSAGSVRRTSPTSLPCIEEAAESDELLSIADSGICDEEYDHRKHYFEPLKFHDNEEYDPDKQISPVSPHFKYGNVFTQKFNNELNKRYNSLTNSQNTQRTNIENELTSSQESNTSLDNISFNSQTTNLKHKNTHKLKKDQDKLPDSLISSMLWNGNTSNQLPSSTGIYTTVPPNRYGQRNQDFMTQLTNHHSSPSSPDRKSSPTPKEFKVSLDVSHYGPDEILVTLEDGKLVVNGKHFSESEYGFEMLQFHRRYPIPEGIKKADIKSTITDEGILVITGRVGSPDLRMMSDFDRLSDYENVPSPKLQRGVSSGRTTPSPQLQRGVSSGRTTPSPTLQRGSSSERTTPSPKLQRGSSSGRTTPESRLHRSVSSGRASPELLSSDENKIISPSLSRKSLSTSDYSDDSRSYSSNVSENDFNETDDNTYILAVNCKGYDPQDLEIKVQSRELIVHGRQKVCTVEDGHERIRHKEFTKRYNVPRNANCHQIMSRFTEHEQLVVEIKKLENSCKRSGITREDILDAL